MVHDTCYATTLYVFNIIYIDKISMKNIDLVLDLMSFRWVLDAFWGLTFMGNYDSRDSYGTNSPVLQCNSRTGNVLCGTINNLPILLLRQVLCVFINRIQNSYVRENN